jgi:Zn-dependent protease/CBS domain-containing protein
MNPRIARETILPASIRLGRVAGIPLGLHYSWFIIAALITLSLEARFRETHPESGAALVFGFSLLTAVLFFITLLAHELSHALVARARGIPVRSITLFALGGIANIVKDANTAATEFLVAVVGPLMSFAIGVGCVTLADSQGWSWRGAEPGVGWTASVLGWLGSINIMLATFNLIPGYPLDGGRVLKSILWGIYRDGDRATRHAAVVGQIVAGLFIASGLVQFFLGAGFGGLWLAFIGWFLLLAAQSTHAQATVAQTLRDVRVADIMTDDCVMVDASTSVRTLVDDLLLRTGRRCAMVYHDYRVLGLVTPNEIRSVDRDRWHHLTVSDVMRPMGTLKTVSPGTSANEAFTTMAREDVNQLPVVDHGRLEGVVTRGQILQLLRSRSELGV